jgi:radical SAM protein with 4Fe4S-binding SPASM domain
MGELYTCDTLTGADNVLGYVADILEGGKRPSVKYDIFADARTAKCVECKLLPLCMGGCMRNRLNDDAQCYWTVESIEKSINDYIRSYG